MPDLKYRQQKIQEKRKLTPWREFVMEICSWMTYGYYRHNNQICKFPKPSRVGTIVPLGTELKIKQSAYTGDFFSSFQELFLDSQHHTITILGSENSNYADSIYQSNNIYLSTMVSAGCSNVLYSSVIKDNCDNIISSLSVYNNCSNVYQSKQIISSSFIFNSTNITNSSFIYGSKDLTGCTHCIACKGLENIAYAYKNQVVGEEEFKRIRSAYHGKNIDSGSSDMLVHSETSSGRYLFNCSGVESGYFSSNITVGRNILFRGGENESENIYDMIGGLGGDHHYGGWSGMGSHQYCNIYSGLGDNIYYCYECIGSSYCLGCLGLKNKSFCIFNKQYTKEERHQKVDEIFSQMESDGTLGQFFPGSMNPFYFNDTAAYLIDDSFTKEEVEAAGYLWRDEVIKVDIPEGVEVVKTSELGEYEGYQNDVWTIDPAILKKVIQDDDGNVYRIVKMEYDFLVKHGLPLPRSHWLDRLKMNFKIA